MTTRPIETLESRRLFATASAIYTLSPDGDLVINAAEANNNIGIASRKLSYILFYNDRAVAAWRRTEVRRVTVFGGAGNDNIRLGGLVASVPALVIGGDGNDTIIGGRGNDTIVGGLGNDNIDGAGGNDLIVGGQGADTLRGGVGNDILFGGPDILSRSNRPIVNVIDGGAGTNTYIGSANTDDTLRRIAVSQPAGYRPPGILFPEDVSVLSPTLSGPATVSGRQGSLSFDYTLPNAASQLVVSPLVRRTRNEFRFNSVALISPDSGTPQTLTQTLTSSNVSAGSYVIRLSTPDGIDGLTGTAGGIFSTFVVPAAVPATPG